MNTLDLTAGQIADVEITLVVTALGCGLAFLTFSLELGLAGLGQLAAWIHRARKMEDRRRNRREKITRNIH